MKQKGFSIIEVLVATALVGGVVLGVFALLGPALKASLISNHMLVASMLAQEGIELVTNIRDTNWYEDFNNPPFDDDPSWRDQLDTSPGNSDRFKNQAGIIDYDDIPFEITYIDSALGIMATSAGGTCVATNENELFQCFGTKLFFNPDKFYVHPDSITLPGFTETPYQRVVIAKYDVPENKLIITSIVRWGSDPTDSSKEVRLTSYLYNWMPSS